MTKPFDERELLARIRSTLRTVAAASRSRQPASMLIDQRLEIDPQRPAKRKTKLLPVGLAAGAAWMISRATTIRSLRKDTEKTSDQGH